jgi:predicted glycoside hydrolase/deacetylase ChbG (UPF0249 family)
MNRSLILVCDDAGFESVDRGIRTLAEETGQPISAEYMVEQEGALERARAIAELQLVSRGLHFELANISDADRFRRGQKLQAEGSSLGEQPDIRAQATKDAVRQLKLFQDGLGVQPAHISTHGNFNTDANGNISEWWRELMDELFEGDVPPAQIEIPYVRHNKYTWNNPETARDPLTPVEFRDVLGSVQNQEIVEFVMHPALPQPDDAPLNMLFNEKMRKRDLVSAVEIIRSNAIQEAGFEIVPVSRVKKRRNMQTQSFNAHL